MTQLLHDSRLAARRLAKEPVFALAAAAVVGLAVGIGTTLFGLVNSIALRPFEFEESPGVVRIAWGSGGRETAGAILPESVSAEIFRQPEVKSLWIAGFSREQAVVAGGGEPQTLFAEAIAGHYFKVVEANAVVGRLLVPSDAAPSAPAVAVVSERYWASERNKGVDLLSRTVLMAGSPTTIVGVVGRTYRGLSTRPFATDLWLPARYGKVHHAFGRLRAGHTTLQADAELKSRVPLEGRYADHNISAKMGMMPPARVGLYLAVAAAMALSGVLVAIAGASLTNLFLARTARRRSEIAIRLMLGATERDIRRLVSMELVLVGLAAVVISLWLAQASVGLAVYLLPGADRFVVDLRPDWRLLTYSTGLAAATMVVLGLALGRYAGGVDPVAVRMAADGAGGITPRTRRDRHRLVGVQVAGSILLLIIAAVLVRAASEGLSYGPGFDPRGGAVGWLDYTHNGVDRERAAVIQERMLAAGDDLAGSGLGSAAVATSLPVRRGIGTEALSDGGTVVSVGLTGVTNQFFEAFGLRLRGGRTFTEADIDGRSAVALLNEDASARLFPEGRPIGRTLTLKANASGGWRSAASPIPSALNPEPGTATVERAETPTTFIVVGVVANTEVGRRGRAGEPHVFVPISRLETNRLAVLTHANQGEAESLRLLRALVAETGRDLILEDVSPIDEAIDGSRGGRAGMGRALAAIGVLTGLIAVLGVNGVVAHLVSHRFRECGVLLSLGASKSEVIRRMTLDVVRTVCLSASGGVLAAGLCCLLLRRYIWSLGVGDWVLVGIIPVAVSVVAVVAAALPVIRATRRPVTSLLRA